MKPRGVLEVCLGLFPGHRSKFHVPPVQHCPPPLFRRLQIRLSKYHRALAQCSHPPQFIYSVFISPYNNVVSLYADFEQLEQDIDTSESSSDLERSPMPHATHIPDRALSPMTISIVLCLPFVAPMARSVPSMALPIPLSHIT